MEDTPPPAAGPSAPVVPAADSIPVTLEMRLGRILAVTDVRRLPDPASRPVARLAVGHQVAVRSQWQGWFAILMADGSFAYVPQPQVELLPYQVRSVITQPTPPPAPVVPPAPSTVAPTVIAQRVIEEAYRYMDTPYVWGGNGFKGIDCSGLVKNCFASAGVRLPRRGGEQAQVGFDVSLNQLQPGDRLYFSVKRTNDHTGIYLGEGKFIHAGRSRGNVGIDSLSQRLFRESLTSARRL